jgi:hypothetical protein
MMASACEIPANLFSGAEVRTFVDQSDGENCCRGMIGRGGERAYSVSVSTVSKASTRCIRSNSPGCVVERRLNTEVSVNPGVGQ